MYSVCCQSQLLPLGFIPDVNEEGHVQISVSNMPVFHGRDIQPGCYLLHLFNQGGNLLDGYANFLEVGELVPADPVAAREWARRSAEQGNVMGIINYGDLLLRGVGGPRNSLGATLLEKATVMGSQYSPHAAITLGQYYRDGQYLPRDVALARQWLEKARARGHPEAEKELQTLR